MLLADFGRADGSLADVNLLCLFAPAPAPKLLDIVEIGSDRLTGLRSTTPELLAPHTPLILFDSEHSNSNQSYQSTEMIYLDGDRFRLLDTVFTCGDEKPPRPGVTIYQATYRWDSAKRRFATTLHDLDKLAAANAKRF